MDKIFEQIANSISDTIKFDSSQKPPVGNMPFGEETAKCLEHFLALARSFGFETVNYDNYAGEVIFGEGEDFAVLAHLDVVPAGNGWTHEPFGGEIDYVNRRIWGRGAMDDKGPAVITLYCMKALKDEGFKPKKRIRLIIGCNEENGWQCIEHFNKVSTMPETGFSPDAEFPVIYAEKGILHVALYFDAPENITYLKGGERPNMVCDRCAADAALDEEKLAALNKKYGGMLSFENGRLISRGKSAHGSTPEAGINAIQPALEYLGLDKMRALLFDDGFKIKDFEDVTGKLTFSPDIIGLEGGKIVVVCDIRFPATYSKESVLGAIRAQGVTAEEVHYQPPLYNDKQCKLIATLCETYNEVTGKNVQPIAIGGGTYARALKCGAGFGPEEAGEECTMHQADEYITFEKIEKCYKIYKIALKKLTQE